MKATCCMSCFKNCIYSPHNANKLISSNPIVADASKKFPFATNMLIIFPDPPTTSTYELFQGPLAICNRVISNIHHIWDIQILLPGIEDSGELKGILKSQEYISHHNQVIHYNFF